MQHESAMDAKANNRPASPRAGRGAGDNNNTLMSLASASNDSSAKRISFTTFTDSTDLGFFGDGFPVPFRASHDKGGEGSAGSVQQKNANVGPHGGQQRRSSAASLSGAKQELADEVPAEPVVGDLFSYSPPFYNEQTGSPTPALAAQQEKRRRSGRLSLVQHGGATSSTLRWYLRCPEIPCPKKVCLEEHSFEL
jgi:hypothetical protein